MSLDKNMQDLLVAAGGWTRMTTVSPNIEIWTNELKEAV